MDGGRTRGQRHYHPAGFRHRSTFAYWVRESIWPQLAATVLPVYVVQTVALMAGLGIFTSFVGSGTAWLITMFRFPAARC